MHRKYLFDECRNLIGSDIEYKFIDGTLLASKTLNTETNERRNDENSLFNIDMSMLQQIKQALRRTERDDEKEHEQYVMLMEKELVCSHCHELVEIKRLIDTDQLLRRRHAAAVDVLHMDFRIIQNKLITDTIQSTVFVQ